MALRKPPVLFDRDGDVAQQLASIVLDCVVEACLALRISHLDLADDPHFVEGIAQFDATAKEVGIFILSGVSTVPALSTAVIRRLSRDMAIVSDIEGGIAPSGSVSV